VFEQSDTTLSLEEDRISEYYFSDDSDFNPNLVKKQRKERLENKKLGHYQKNVNQRSVLYVGKRRQPVQQKKDLEDEDTLVTRHRYVKGRVVKALPPE
jgi:hypothetical protein